MQKDSLILAVDTSCDETSVAIVQGLRVLSNAISSQIRYHKKFGGVVPFLAKRLHKERIDSVIELAFQRSGLNYSIDRPDYLAITVGPGLAPALEVGLEKIKELSALWQLPIIPVNHMTGHIAGCFAQVGKKKNNIEYPFLAVLVSGGHSEFIYCRKWGEYEIVGQTLDDALGEAYDKVAKMLGLGYPGGKLVSKLAEEGDPAKYELPIPMLRSGDYNLSYSGLKNAVRLFVDKLKEQNNGSLDRKMIVDLCASFEEVAQVSLTNKLQKILDKYEVGSLLIGGGVASNNKLRSRIRRIAKTHINKGLICPLNFKLCTDNAAMIGVSAYLYLKYVPDSVIKPDNISLIDRKPGMDINEKVY